MEIVNPKSSFRWSEPLDINGVAMMGIREKQGYAFSRAGWLAGKDADQVGIMERYIRKPESRRYLERAREDYQLGRVPEFPYYFIIEPTNICNRTCPFCSIAVVNRVRDDKQMFGHMRWVDFDKLMFECARYEVYGISLYQLGEPFLWREGNRNIGDMCDLARSCGFKSINLSTNGDVPTLSLALEHAVDELIISIDGLTQEVYDQNRTTRNNDTKAFGRTIDRVHDFLRKKAARGQDKPFVRLQIINNASTCGEVVDFIRYWIAIDGVDDVFVKELDAMMPWIGERAVSKEEADIKMASVADMACQHLWSIGSMTAAGALNACCHDARTELTDGAYIQNMSFREWWHGKFMTRLRSEHASKEFRMPCHDCHERDPWLG